MGAVVSGEEWQFASPSYAPATETEFAQARVPNRLYTSKTFTNRNPNSSDHGQPSRFAYQVFDADRQGGERRRRLEATHETRFEPLG